MEGFWKWELERRLAVRRWDREDAEMAEAEASAAGARAPLLEVRRAQLARREQEGAGGLPGGATSERPGTRADRIACEDAEWLALTARWQGEDRLRALRREQREAQRRAEIERWLDENSWEIVNLPDDVPASQRLLQ